MPAQCLRGGGALLVGYEEQENLGLRSILACLTESGIPAEIVRFVPGDHAPVLEAAARRHPDLIGFSIIFQYTLDDFAALAAALRQAGCKAHLTVGGHFPSLRPREVLEAIPQLDSAVRFEGELTAVELTRQVSQGGLWTSVQGLAFRGVGGRIVVNTSRPLVPDLDVLPWPARGEPQSLTRGVRVASMLASRGCLYDCSFCSIRQFYGSAPGPLRRVRRPEAVVAEMRALHDVRGIRFFIFQDDDFAARSSAQRRWVDAFLHELDLADLTGRVAWKISCRVDDVDAALFARCRQHGLLAVYLGVESGNAVGLSTLHKRATVADNLRAVTALKEIGVGFDMGFMLFDPDSTVESVKANIAFLRGVTADGACPADFAKMLPYAGTPIESRLAHEGRLRGTWTQPDYDFVDARLDLYALYVARVFQYRSVDTLGLLERLRLARFDQLLARAFDATADADEYERRWRALTARANQAALDALDDGLAFVSSRSAGVLAAEWDALGAFARKEWEAEIALHAELDGLLGVHSPELLHAYTAEIEWRSRGEGANASAPVLTAAGAVPAA
jgi:anaerobic magnesium-protoporphyrin IX monomethyl ester cyclase